MHAYYHLWTVNESFEFSQKKDKTNFKSLEALKRDTMLECLEFLGIPNSEPLIRSDHILSRNVQVSWRAHRFIYHLLLDTILHCIHV